MLDRTGAGKGFQQIAHHSGVDLDVFSFCRLPKPGCEEDMRRLDSFQAAAKRVRLEQVRCNRVNSSTSGRITCKAVNPPVRLLCKVLCEVETHNACCTDH